MNRRREDRDQELAEALQLEELGVANPTEETWASEDGIPPRRFEPTIFDLEDDRKLAERLQREEEAEYLALNDETPPRPRDPEHVADFRAMLRNYEGLSLVDPQWETIDPTPDIYAMFQVFDDMFFQGVLRVCTVSWSSRMTSSAGLCCFKDSFCSIRLSRPLLTLRPRADLVETLLHEMIHAYVFLIGKSRSEGRDGHGPEFHKHMYRINKQAKCNITVYHTFHDEVRYYQMHHWRCDGACRDQHPFYGWVRRSRNCAPSKNDRWWADHQRRCGGTFIKVAGPEMLLGIPKKDRKRKNSSSRKTVTGDVTGSLSKMLKKTAVSTDSSTARPGTSGVGKTSNNPPKPSRPGGSPSKIKGFSGFSDSTKPSTSTRIFKSPIPTLSANFTPFQGVGNRLGSDSGEKNGTPSARTTPRISITPPTPDRLRQPTLDEIFKGKASASSDPLTDMKKRASIISAKFLEQLMDDIFSSDEDGAATETKSNAASAAKKPNAGTSPKKRKATAPTMNSRNTVNSPQVNNFYGNTFVIIDDESDHDGDRVNSRDSPAVSCPVCSCSFPESDINAHLDCCLGE